MSLHFSYRHLYYFWVVAKEGGITRGAERLGMAVQTVSAQVRELERALGHALLRPSGRGVALTEAGIAAMHKADRIFALGEELSAAVREAGRMPALRLAVGVSDALAKMLVQHAMRPVLAEPGLKLVCQVGEFDDLLADLALHRLDVVLADRPAPLNPNLKVYSHRLGDSGVAWYGSPALAARAREGFPRSLSEVPVLLPTDHAALRAGLDVWFDRQGVTPRIAGEFEDSALLKTFGAAGLGVFPVAEVVEADLCARYGVERIGASERVEEHLWAIGTERRIVHPLVQRLVPGGGATAAG